LIRSGFDSKKLFWAPPPSIPKEATQRFDYDGDKRITIGFLGNARPNKGFEEIPELLESLVEEDVQYKAIIQRAKFPWLKYRKALEKMEQFKHSIILISPDQKEQDLEAIMRKVDICVLPYNPVFYKLQSSAIVYRAADLGIPVIAKKGVAFADEILKYGIGEVYESASEFPFAVKNVLSELKVCAISEYNRKRTNAAEFFLGMN
jgi:glycosyltransferase involved in cell wall biosynthesis